MRRYVKQCGINSVLLAIVLLASGNVIGQHLTLQDAVKMGLQENLGLEVATKAIDISKVNTGNGAAGMLPTITAYGDLNYALANTRQQFLNGGENQVAAGSTLRANTGVRLAWTVFDGMAMYTRRDRLLNEYELASIDLKMEAQALSASISSSYQNLVLQDKLIKIFDENIGYLQEPVELSNAKLEIGSVSKLDVLQAQTDLNEVISAQELAKMEYEMSIAALNRDLNQDATQNFSVDTSFVVPTELLDYQGWVAKTLRSNFEIKRSEKAYEIAKKDVDLVEASSLPRVDLNSAFDVGYLSSNAGFLTSNRALGPSLGVSVNYNLWDGDRIKREMQIAELRSKMSELTIERVSLETKNELFILFQRYNYFVEQSNLEKENLSLSEENFELASALFRNGSLTQFELRQVRIQRLAIQRRLVQAEFQQAVSYIGLMELSGESWL